MPNLAGQPAAERDAILERVRPLTPERLAALVRDWRETRTGVSLSRLFHQYMRGRKPHSVRMKDLVDILGPPTSGGRDEMVLFYEATPAGGPGLVIDSDERGRLKGWSFS